MIYIIYWQISDVKDIEAVFTTLEEAQKALDVRIDIDKEDPNRALISTNYWIVPVKIFTDLDEYIIDRIQYR